MKLALAAVTLALASQPAAAAFPRFQQRSPDAPQTVADPQGGGQTDGLFWSVEVTLTLDGSNGQPQQQQQAGAQGQNRFQQHFQKVEENLKALEHGAEDGNCATRVAGERGGSGQAQAGRGAGAGGQEEKKAFKVTLMRPTIAAQFEAWANQERVCQGVQGVRCAVKSQKTEGEAPRENSQCASGAAAGQPNRQRRGA